MDNFFENDDLLYLFIHYLESIGGWTIPIQCRLLRVNKLTRKHLLESNCQLSYAIKRLTRLDYYIRNSNYHGYKNLTDVINDSTINWLVHRFRKPLKSQGIIPINKIIMKLNNIDRVFLKYGETLNYLTHNIYLLNESITVNYILFSKELFEKPINVRLNYEIRLNTILNNVEKQREISKYIYSKIKNTNVIMLYDTISVHSIIQNYFLPMVLWYYFELEQFIEILNIIINVYTKDANKFNEIFLNYYYLFEENVDNRKFSNTWVELTYNYTKYKVSIDAWTEKLENEVSVYDPEYNFCYEAIFVAAIELNKQFKD